MLLSYRVTMNIMGSREGQGGRLGCACQTVSVVFLKIINNFMALYKIEL